MTVTTRLIDINAAFDHHIGYVPMAFFLQWPETIIYRKSRFESLGRD